jgi:DNA-binding GntR family transcriptional regulator
VKPPIFKPSELKDWAYATIKQMILDSEFKVDEQLPVEALSSRLHISRTPIREALLKLESEGLVRAASRVGFFVRGVTRQDLLELFELRALTEGYAAEKAATMVSEEELTSLEALHRRSVQAVEEGDLSRFMDSEVALHTLILQLAHNRRLMRMVDSIKNLTHRERILSLNSLENVKMSLDEHQRILAALRRRDPQKAGAAMRAHIELVRERMLGFLDLPEEEET